jgi:hypothetical protein
VGRGPVLLHIQQPNDCVQGHAALRGAAQLLPGPAGREVCKLLCHLPSPLQHQHHSQVAAGAANEVPGPQRRDQHAAGECWKQAQIAFQGTEKTETRRKYVTKAVSKCESSLSIIAGDLSDASFHRSCFNSQHFLVFRMGQGSRSYRPADYAPLQIMAGYIEFSWFLVLNVVGMHHLSACLLHSFLPPPDKLPVHSRRAT